MRTAGTSGIAALAAVAGAALAGGLGAPGGAEPAGPQDRCGVAVSAGGEFGRRAERSERRTIRRLWRSARSVTDPAPVTIDYPLEGSIFPPEIVAPTFLWHDESEIADRWLVDVAFASGKPGIRVLVEDSSPPRGEIDPRCVAPTNEIYEPTPYQASARAWKPCPELWAAIKARSVAAAATVTFLGYREDAPSSVVSRGSLTLRTSRDPVGAPVFFRDVPLMPAATEEGVIKPLDKTAQPLIAWRLRDLSREQSRVLLRDMPTCANCHSFSADGSTLAMDIDGPSGDKGAYGIAPIRPQMVIRDEHVITWNAFPGIRPGLNTLGFLARISPDGRHVVATVNESLYVQNFTDHRFSQVFYPTRGVLAYLERESGEIRGLPGADDPRYVHCDPAWTPDGRALVFARAGARDPYIPGRPAAKYAGDPNETPIRYDLYRIPFDEGRGGTPVPIEGASFNGMSNSFPKVSPDGRWIVFVQSKNGQLMRPDGKLWIVPVEGGAARPLESNLPLMNSWHSFSPNGRWMVFSSKSNTPYTQMFLTHIDEAGHASPAILIENNTAANRAVNIPEFVNIAYDDLTSISVPAVEHYHFFRRGNQLAREGKYAEAVAVFERALEGGERDWRVGDWRIHDSLSKTLMKLGRDETALEHIAESLKLNPLNGEMHANFGYLLAERGETDRAMKHLEAALRLRPRDPVAWYNRGSLRLTLGDEAAAIEDFTEAIRLDPGHIGALSGRGMLLGKRGELSAALADFDRAVRLAPDDPTPSYFRALILRQTGRLEEAEADLSRALAATPAGPEGASRRRDIEAALEQVRAARASGS